MLNSTTPAVAIRNKDRRVPSRNDIAPTADETIVVPRTKITNREARASNETYRSPAMRRPRLVHERRAHRRVFVSTPPLAAFCAHHSAPASNTTVSARLA